MSVAASVLADGVPGWPPSLEDFYLPSLFSGAYPWITKFTLLIWLGAAIVLIFFLVAYRSPKMVPTKMQWIAESIYGFGRESVAREVIGVDGLRFAPYLTTLLCFILVTNIFAIVPFIQISPNSHIAFPAVLATISYVLFFYLGAKKHGFWGFVKHSIVVPGVPIGMLLLVSPIEFISTFLLRPFTLSVRLFANMFAGHVILLVFTLGGFVLINTSGWVKVFAPFSWAMAILLTFFELLVCALQAYVFALLTSSYVQGALAEDH